MGIRICKLEECERKHAAKGYCTVHYARWKSHGDPLYVERVRNSNPPERCTREDCEELHAAKGFCKKHYAAMRRSERPLNSEAQRCSVEDCPKPRQAKGFCSAHYQRWRKYGDPSQAAPSNRPRAKCSIEGCGNVSLSRGLCSKHYNRLQSHGDPLATKVTRRDGQREGAHSNVGRRQEHRSPISTMPLTRVNRVLGLAGYRSDSSHNVNQDR